MPQVPNVAPEPAQRYRRMKARAIGRDNRMHLIREVRNGNMRQMFPDELNLSMDFQGAPIANFVDIAARDLAEVIAPLPSLACTAGKMKTQADLQRAQTKNRIGANYWEHSELELNMLWGADRYITYGFLPFFIEPDPDNKLPYIVLDDPQHAYYEVDRHGKCVVYAKRWLKSVDELCSAFPEYARFIRYNPKDKRNDSGDTQLELIRWVDDTTVSLMLPERDGAILRAYDHKLSRLPVHIARRPGLDDNPRGQFDDVIWVQVAKAIMKALTLEAANTAVQAPIVLPSDMDELPVGPKAIFQSDNPQHAQRLNLEVPNGIFVENQDLDQEIKTGSRYPDARTGNSNASVITGKGVEALLGTFDTQIKGAQMVLRAALKVATSICFEMDEVWWPHDAKTINGNLAGLSYEVSYTPAEDIAGRWSCEVTYGFAAGMHPTQSMILMMQLQGAGLLSADTIRENMPFTIDSLQEGRRVEIEKMRQALQQGIFALIENSGAMAAQGQDPTSTIQLATTAIKLIQNGVTVEDALDQAFAQKQQADQAAQQQAQQAAQAAAASQGAGAGPGGGAPSGVPGGGPGGQQAAPPGQAGMPPGGQPTIQDMMSGFRGDAATPVMSDVVRRRQATGGQ